MKGEWKRNALNRGMNVGFQNLSNLICTFENTSFVVGPSTFFSYFEADNWKEHFSFFALQFKMKEKSKTIINFYRRPGG